MGYTVALIITGLATLGGGLTTFFVQARVGIEDRRRHHDVGAVVFLQLGVVFAVLLAFVFSEVWGEFNQAAQAIDLEVSAMHGTSIIAATLPAADAKQVLAKEQSYLDSVIEREWPVMARTRAADPATVEKLEILMASVADLQSLNPADRDKKNEMLALLAQAHTERETRIFQAGSGVPAPLWCLLIAFTLLLTVFVSFSGIESRVTAAVMAGCFVACVVAILMIAKLLDYPFEGALALQPTDFMHVADRVRALAAHGLPGL